MIELLPAVALAAPGESVDGYDRVIRVVPDRGVAYPPWHDSTRAAARAMESIDLAGASVLDFGAGSGVLSVLAHQLGATVTSCEYIPAIKDIAAQTFEANGLADIRLLDRDDGGSYDVIVANVGDVDVLIPLIPRCGTLIGTMESKRKHVAGGRGTPPVWKPGTDGMLEIMSGLGRTAIAEEFAPGWAVVRG